MSIRLSVHISQEESKDIVEVAVIILERDVMKPWLDPVGVPFGVNRGFENQ